MTKIVLDYGHGEGKAFNRGGVLFNEGDNDYEFGKLLKAELEKYEDIKVFETRATKSSNPSLSARASMFNKEHPNLFISIHSNAYNSRVSGVEAFYRSSNPNTSNTLLKRMVDKTVDVLGIRNRGVKDYPFGVLGNGNNAKVKMLIEMFFHDNIADSKKYLKNKKTLAEQYAKVIADYYSKKKKSVSIPTTDKGKTQRLYRVSVGAFANRSNAETLMKNLKAKGFSPYVTLEDINL